MKKIMILTSSLLLSTISMKCMEQKESNGLAETIEKINAEEKAIDHYMQTHNLINDNAHRTIVRQRFFTGRLILNADGHLQENKNTMQPTYSLSPFKIQYMHADNDMHAPYNSKK